MRIHARLLLALGPTFLVGLHVTPATATFFCGHIPCPQPSTVIFLQGVGYDAQGAAEVGLTGIQQHIWSIEDRLQCLIGSADQNVLQPTSCRRRIPSSAAFNTFAEESSATDPVVESAFSALGYSGMPSPSESPILLKAPPPSPTTSPPSTLSVSAWGQGSVDDSVRTGTSAGFDIGSRTLTWAGIAGTDVTTRALTSASDAFVFGILGTYTTASTHNADGSLGRVDGPSVGAYAAYVNGGFSVDGTFKTDFLNIENISSGINFPFGMQNYSAVGNVHYKQYVGSGWYEPTAGVTYTRSAWDGASKAFGMIDGTDVRVQGGVRFGADSDWAGIHFSNTLALLAYDDVLINGGTLAVAVGTPLAPTLEGRIFGQAIGRFEAQFTSNWSASLEGEFRGSTDIYGLAGRVTLTYRLN